MNEKSISEDEVIRYLRHHKVLQTLSLAEHFGCSKKTIFRKLKRTGYLTSYNRNKSGLTLPDIPVFDTKGLWEYRGFYFSQWKTLTETIHRLVENSDAGLTAGKLRRLLRHDNIYHQITECVNAGRIFRDTTHRYPIYYSMVPQKRKEQVRRRERILEKAPAPPLRLSKDKIIQVLVVALKQHVTSVEEVMPLLRAERVRVSEKNVEWVFEKYEIKKKRSRLKSSKKSLPRRQSS